jgi:hypothetical protein
VLQKRALERRGVKDAPQEAQKLLRSRARLPIVPMQSISPLGHGSRRGPSLFVFRFAVMRGHGRVRVAPSHAERNLLEPLLGATAGRLSR